MPTKNLLYEQIEMYKGGKSSLSFNGNSPSLSRAYCRFSSGKEWIGLNQIHSGGLTVKVLSKNEKKFPHNGKLLVSFSEGKCRFLLAFGGGLWIGFLFIMVFSTFCLDCFYVNHLIFL